MIHPYPRSSSKLMFSSRTQQLGSFGFWKQNSSSRVILDCRFKRLLLPEDKSVLLRSSTTDITILAVSLEDGWPTSNSINGGSLLKDDSSSGHFILTSRFNSPVDTWCISSHLLTALVTLKVTYSSSSVERILVSITSFFSSATHLP